MVKICYKDIAWTNEGGEVIPMEYLRFMIVNSRIHHKDSLPVIVEENWNNKRFPVQFIYNETYELPFSLKEVSIHEVSKLLLSKDVTIESTETNQIITVDTETSGLFTYEPVGNFGSVDMSFNLMFSDKNKRTVVNRLARNNTNYLSIVFDSATYTYYSDFDILSFTEDAEKEQYESAYDGHAETTLSKFKQGKRMLFILPESDMVNLKKHVENSVPATIDINDQFVPVETGKCTVSLIGEGLYRCEVEFITYSNFVNDYA